MIRGGDLACVYSEVEARLQTVETGWSQPSYEAEHAELHWQHAEHAELMSSRRRRPVKAAQSKSFWAVSNLYSRGQRLAVRKHIQKFSG